MPNESLDPAGRILLTGEGRDEWGHRFFKFAVRGSDAKIPPFSTKKIMENPKLLFSELTDAGANVFHASARHHILHQIDKRQPQRSKFKVVTRLGWTSGAFLRPDKIIGRASTTLEPSFRHLDQQVLGKYQVKGTLKEWRTKIGKLCTGNSHLMFCACLGLTGPILPLVTGPRSGGFQLFGLPESGKTAAAMVTGSIWGCHRSPERRENGFAESWHTTEGKVEITALAHNETILILDETKRGSDKERAQAVRDISFGLAECVERDRLTNLGSVRGWQLYFLSTSNYSFDELAQRGGIDIDDAERGRLVDVPNPDAGHGIYEDLHGYANGQQLTDTLKVRCRKYCGTVGVKLLRRLVKHRASDPAGLKQFLKQQRMTYLAAIKARSEDEGLRPLNRASGRFATVYAAGSLAIKYRLLPFDQEELLEAILSCQLDGLRIAKGKEPTDRRPESDPRDTLIAFLREHRSEFLDLRKGKPLSASHEFGSVPGYIAAFQNKKWFYLTGKQLERIIGVGANAAQLKKELVNQGLMARSSSGRYVVQRPIFAGLQGNKGHEWVHAIRLRILQDGRDE